jgi:hypothetical protein
MLYSFFWVIPQPLNFCVPTFRNTLSVPTSCRVNKKILFLFTRPIKMEQTECSETSALKIQTPGNHPKERIQQNLIRHPVKSGLPGGTKGPIEAHHRATFTVLHQCVYASFSYGCIYCALYWSNWILVHVFMYPHQAARQNHSIRTANESSENAVKITYSEHH